MYCIVGLVIRASHAVSPARRWCTGCIISASVLRTRNFSITLHYSTHLHSARKNEEALHCTGTVPCYILIVLAVDRLMASSVRYVFMPTFNIAKALSYHFLDHKLMAAKYFGRNRKCMFHEENKHVGPIWMYHKIILCCSVFVKRYIYPYAIN